MRHLNKNQWIAVCVALALLAYLLFTGPIMSFFNPPENNLGSQIPQTGVITEDVVVGEGPLAEPGDVVTVHYVGRLPDGRVFDSSRDRNISFSFILGSGQVIRGWDEGFNGMRVGGKRQLIIAPDYAYGESGVGAIPPNSTLFFEVELL